jgi:hypothetical protein
MFEVKVTVAIPGLPEAISALASAVSKSPAPAQAAPATLVVTDPAGHAPVAQDPVAPVSAPAPVPVASAMSAPAPVATAPASVPVQAPEPAQTVTPAPAPTTPNITPDNAGAQLTVEDIGRAGATLVDMGKMPQLLALLAQYGVQAVTQLQPAQLAPFADGLRALGAKF